MRFRARRFTSIATLCPAGTGGGGGGGTTTFDPSNKDTLTTLSNGNLTTTTSSGNQGYQYARSIASHSTGKYYWEMTVSSSGFDGTGQNAIGIGDSSGIHYFNTSGGTTYPGIDIHTAALFDNNAGLYINNASNTALAANYAAGDTIGFALDAGGALIWVRNYHLGSASNWNNSGTADPATGVGGISVSAITAPYYAYAWAGKGETFTANFGGSAFAMTAPSGFGNL